MDRTGIIIRSKEYSRKGGRRGRRSEEEEKRREGGTMMLRATNGRVTRVWIEQQQQEGKL